MKCICCECKAKYDASGELVCGRHLTYVVDRLIEMPPNSAKVTRIKTKSSRNRENEGERQ